MDEKKSGKENNEDLISLFNKKVTVSTETISSQGKMGNSKY